MFSSDDYKNYRVTDVDFVLACDRASHYAKQRCLKKMTKKPLPKDAEEYVKRFVYFYVHGSKNEKA